VSWREHAPEPGRLWIRWTPKRWPAGEHPHLDLADHRIVWPGPPVATGAELWLPEPPRRDLVGLPPVPETRTAQRDAFVRALEEAGSPALVQVTGSETPPAAVVVLDLLATLLGVVEPFERRGRTEAPLWVVLPLLPGIVGEETLEGWLDRIASLAPAAVIGLTPELEPLDRRRLAEGREALYESIFHGAPIAERRFAQRAAARGLPVFPRRPVSPADPPRLARNRELAAELAEAGELWLKLGRGEPEGQALLAAARHLEATPLDFTALAREGNLGVVSWLSEASRAMIEERVATGTAARLEALRAAWIGGEP
jgi:hypothetical protein